MTTSSQLTSATPVTYITVDQYDEVARTVDAECKDNWIEAIEATLEDGRFVVKASEINSDPDRIATRLKATIVALGARTNAAVETLEAKYGTAVRIEESANSCPGFRFIVSVEDDLHNATDYLFAFYEIGALAVKTVRDAGFSLCQIKTDVARQGSGPDDSGDATPLWDIQASPLRFGDAAAGERDSEGHPAYWRSLAEQPSGGGFGGLEALLGQMRA